MGPEHNPADDDEHVECRHEIERLTANVALLTTACEAAKKYLEPDLVEPGRTVFWQLVDALKQTKGDV